MSCLNSSDSPQLLHSVVDPWALVTGGFFCPVVIFCVGASMLAQAQLVLWCSLGPPETHVLIKAEVIVELHHKPVCLAFIHQFFFPVHIDFRKMG